ncbi:MAG: polyphosphate kinase 2 family protein [Verrucomicrobiae bacterium]|nr:polyphosphate kinase 2 family protein [Verrucomicrobiae bacterium]
MKIKCHLEDYRIEPGSKVDLTRRPTEVKPLYQTKKEYAQRLEEYVSELRDLQSVLYAHNRYALLLIFQGMDAAGKDGAIRHVMSGVNPQGCQVSSFKEPSSEELDHDFLWRTHRRLPERGRIGIFNRSYYEEVLIVRVRPDVLARQRVPEEFVRPPALWRERYRDIVNMEDYLHRNGTRIVKFFLHLSKEEQRCRFLARIDEGEKNWKLGPADIEMRKHWDAFQDAYADCLGATSTSHAPWYVVPADDKKNARLIISHAIVETLKTLKMAYPEPTEADRKALREARKGLKK